MSKRDMEDEESTGSLPAPPAKQCKVPKSNEKSAPSPTPDLFDLMNEANPSWEDVLKRCESHPEDARWVDSEEDPRHPRFRDPSNPFWEGKLLTPLHMAMFRGAPTRVVGALLAANPQADCLGPYPPLHVALRRDPGMTNDHGDRIDLFFERYPSDDWLHRALNVPLDVARIVLSYAPHPGTVRAEDGRTALHYVCACRCRPGDAGRSKSRSLELLRLLRPEGASVPDHLGQTPLHIACGTGSTDPPVALIASLINASPGALTMRSRNNGQTPLHAACASLKSSRVIEVLLDRAPSAASMLNKHDLTPLFLYVSASVSYESQDKEEVWRTAMMLAEATPRDLFWMDRFGYHPPGQPRSKVRAFMEELCDKLDARTKGT